MLKIRYAHLGVFHPEGAAAGVDIRALQRVPGVGGGLHGLELHHGLHAVLLEDHDAQHVAVGLGDRVDHILETKINN